MRTCLYTEQSGTLESTRLDDASLYLGVYMTIPTLSAIFQPVSVPDDPWDDLQLRDDVTNTNAI